MKAKLKLIKIGVGHFSTAYTTAQLEKCYIKSRCMTKEAYALGFSEESTLFPQVDKVFDLDLPLTEREEDEGFNWYVMPLYTKVKAPSKQLKFSDYLLYKALREMQLEMVYHSFTRELFGLDVIRKGFDSLLEKGITQDTVDLLHEMLDTICNAVDTRTVRFEISPRNIALDKEGNMVLLDCFFDSAELRWNK